VAVALVAAVPAVDGNALHPKVVIEKTLTTSS